MDLVALRPEEVGDRVFFYGKGCDYCNNTGYRGRMGIYELMVLDDPLRELIMRKASTSVLRREAIKRGMRTLRETGLMAARLGGILQHGVFRQVLHDVGDLHRTAVLAERCRHVLVEHLLGGRRDAFGERRVGGGEGNGAAELSICYFGLAPY